MVKRSAPPPPQHARRATLLIHWAARGRRRLLSGKRASERASERLSTPVAHKFDHCSAWRARPTGCECDLLLETGEHLAASPLRHKKEVAWGDGARLN